MKMLRAAGSRLRTWRAPCQSISSNSNSPLRSASSHRAQAGSVEIVEHLRMLEKLAALGHFLELRMRDEMIVAALDLVGPRLARGVGHREAQPRLAFHQRLHQAGLAGARRRSDHVQASDLGAGPILLELLGARHSILLDVLHLLGRSASINLINNDIHNLDRRSAT